MIHPELSIADLDTMTNSIYENFTWSHEVYVEYDDTFGYDITLEFTSPIDFENQRWEDAYKNRNGL